MHITNLGVAMTNNQRMRQSLHKTTNCAFMSFI